MILFWILFGLIVLHRLCFVTVEGNKMITKSQIVLKQQGDVLMDAVWFENLEDDNGGIQYELSMPQSTYLAMGTPTEITVTVEPGDKLNK